MQDPVKADAGHVAVEKYLSENFGNWAVFRPQYMVGSGNNKDCEEWFFDSKFINLRTIFNSLINYSSAKYTPNF